MDTRQALIDALAFIRGLPYASTIPRLGRADDGEIVLDWGVKHKRVTISFEGDKKYGYALFFGGQFLPGKEIGIVGQQRPRDLDEYLFSMKGLAERMQDNPKEIDRLINEHIQELF